MKVLILLVVLSVNAHVHIHFQLSNFGTTDGVDHTSKKGSETLQIVPRGQKETN